MTVAIPCGKAVLTSDEAAAYAAVLARVQAIGCYPITPQTVIVERLAELAAGRQDVEYAMLESEHSMLGYVIAASRAGARAFTATSSQGLLYAHEQLHRTARERVPLVMVNVNRAILAPWSLEADHADSLSQRDTGWIQVYCASAQEVLDSVLCAYRVAESAMLPVMVCAEGFLLSHTAEILEVPAQEEVDAFLPPFRPPGDWLLDPARPRAFSEVPEAREYAAFQRGVAEALDGARGLVEDVAAAYSERFGRTKAGALALAGNPAAARAVVSMGTIGDTALELLDEDDDLLAVRVHVYRPFPAAALVRALSRVREVAVIDRTPAFGALAPLGADVRALGLDARVADFVCGVGGTDVTPQTLRWALDATAAHAGGEAVFVPEEV